jgi:hypothetical protein
MGDTVFMPDGDSAELHAKWATALDIGRFQELLNAETEDGKYKILAQLLSYEFEQISPRSTLIPANNG